MSSSPLSMQLNKKEDLCSQVQSFKSLFSSKTPQPKYIFGINVYTESVLEHIKVDGLVDDFTLDPSFKGIPILKSDAIETNAVVLVCSGGRPLSIKRNLDARGIKNIDYFAFSKYSPELKLREIVFNEDFSLDYHANLEQYQWTNSILADKQSKSIFEQLVKFRLHHDLKDLQQFNFINSCQYFEPFLLLKRNRESFLDIGGFDGRDTIEFIKRCPGYSAIHIFEPSPESSQKCKKLVGQYSNLYVHELGLSDRKDTLLFDLKGSASHISESGTHQIAVDRLDNVLMNGCVPTFIKMDIEGSELSALEGASHTIENFGPRLAISVYHKSGDFWKIPKKILQIRADYDVYLRHYSESIYETVMFFIRK